ncbi:presenilin family intramembrane aspartyl protease PSH [Natrinema salsiterrestre]|uniref:Presenilin family intramembrane aspartyl protease n=1 Tax=Natrinema salsiterrestre TaxID=2950540 RepID=A0A9Q4KZ55_9EURY|nr:presenilin family intramembrane aspartyl protease PSH [Natrinema salsiterrestre]MDF9746708.1 presenilin family intramembrane aspartyl protease [Natrinema salsiterrestre]
MNDRTRILAAVGTTVLLFLGIQLGALALLEPFTESGRQAVDDPENPINSILYVGVMLVATGLMLAAFRYDLDWLIRLLLVGVSVMISWYVFAELVPAVVAPFVSDGVASALAIVASLAVGAALLWYPEWYVIDGAGVVMGAGAAALFGISFGLLPALVLLSVLAVYDAISVYGTEHMLDLAEGVMDLKIPVVLVVPMTLSYSYLAAGSTDDALEDGSAGTEADTEAADGGTVSDAQPEASAVDADEAPEKDSETDAGALDRDALFIGLGDAVIPTILVASAAAFLDVGVLAVPGIALNLPALGASLGTIAGLLVLMYMVLEGRAHAGLPLLNGGAIGGYLLGALASGLSIATAIGL